MSENLPQSDPSRRAAADDKASSSARAGAGRWSRWRRAAADWLGGRRITVGVDLRLMQPGGANGGVKPLVFSFLGEIGRARPARFRFVYCANAALAPELQPLVRARDKVVTGEGGVPEWDVLYAPFGRSELMRRDIPTVSLIVDLLHRDLPAALPVEEVNFRHRWFTQIAAEAACFQCISHYTAAQLQRHYGVPAARCFVTHVAVQERLTKLTGGAAPVSGKYFFYPANAWPHKNHEILLEACRQYREGTTGTPWPLVLTGHPDARMQAIEERAARMGLKEGVHFFGHLDEENFAAAWRAAGALVYPSRHEGFGIPLLEAMAFGVPVIAANATSLPEVGGDACRYVDPEDPASVAKAMRELAGNEAVRGELIRRGRRRLGEFSLACEASRLADELEKAAGAKRRD